MGWRRGSCREPRAALFKGWARREKEGLRNAESQLFLEMIKPPLLWKQLLGIELAFFLSRIIAFRVGVIVYAK